MDDWTEMERGALMNFLASDGALLQALKKFTANRAREMEQMCTMHMATVPRDHESASDCAAKAQELGEFWTLLTERVLSAGEVPAPVPTQV